jgi:hypothetical protein
MRADVFQAVAIGCHARAYLSGHSEQVPEFLSHSTFSTVHEVDFVRGGTPTMASGIVADAVAPWLRRLRKESVERLAVTLAGCPLDPLQPVSESYGILTDGDVGVEIWQPHWKKRIGGHSDLSPWCVRYTSSRASRWSLQAPPRTADILALLTALVKEVSGAHPLLQQLRENEEPRFADLFPADWPEPQRACGMLAAEVAFLLRSPEWTQDRELDHADQLAISQKLWKAAMTGFEAAANVDESASERSTDQNHSSFLRRSA